MSSATSDDGGPHNDNGGGGGTTRPEEEEQEVVDGFTKPTPTPNKMITILGFGSLLSERSSRMTFPDLVNFRLGRIPNYRRVFRQPTSLFFRHGIANLETKEMASLSAEACPWICMHRL